MDEEGVDVAVLFPSRGLFVLGLDSAEHVGADGLEPGAGGRDRPCLQRLAGRLLQRGARRLLGAGLLAPHDVDAAVDEVHRASSNRSGSRPSSCCPACVNGRAWHDPAYDPIWRTCEQLGVPFCFHGGGQNYLRPDYTLEFDNLMMWHTFGQPVGIMAVTVSMTAGGVLQRFPDLRVGLLEGNCGWAPWLLDRLDEHWEWVGDKDAPELDRAPSEYFRSNCFLSIEADERPASTTSTGSATTTSCSRPTIRTATRSSRVGDRTFLELPIDEDTKRKVLWENWCRLYGMPTTT